MAEGTATAVPALRWRHGAGEEALDPVAMEVPVALTFNREPHVVLMATPGDLEDLAVGFAFTEGLLGGTDELGGTRVIPRERGIEVALTVSVECRERAASIERRLESRSSCGLCGVKTLEAALRPPAPVGDHLRLAPAALARAIDAMAARQALQQESGAVHAAAWCAQDGTPTAIREDVGRHNALDKLVGARLRAGTTAAPGFVVISSRASYEMVAKAAAAGVELLAAVSAPTGLAIDFARQAGMTLLGFARPGRYNVYHGAHRIEDGNE
ncbi:MAG: formate dehydrogenase accessory sulfurtransferase FdhD [Pseudomonadota bacterium]